MSMSEEGTRDGAAERATQPEAAAAALDAARREAEDNWNRYVRTVAELDNLRKRAEREIEGARKYGAERLAQALLPVRDSLEAGLAASGAADKTALVEGQQATLRLLDAALAAAGVSEIDPKGLAFDPTKHEALSVLAAEDAEPNSVLEVIQKGYEMNERLLRAAKVIVSRPEG